MRYARAPPLDSLSTLISSTQLDCNRNRVFYQAEKDKEMSQEATLECVVCQYRTTMFGDFVNHPCQQRQLEQQDRLEKRMKRIKLEQFIFCPVCGHCRRKVNEQALRAGKLHFGNARDHCLMCHSHYDQDWSFMEKVFFLPWGYTIDLFCPHDDCNGEMRFDRDAFWPILEWYPGRRKREQPIPQLKRKQLYRTCDICHRPAQPHFLLPYPKNRLRLLSTITDYRKHFEMEQLRQLKRFNPTDDRVSQQAWEKWRQIWEIRKARVAWEVEHEGVYVPYPEEILQEGGM